MLRPDFIDVSVRRVATIVFAALIVPLAAAPGQANHLQTDSGRSITFDSTSGNEWWVQVTVGGSGAGSVTNVEVQAQRADGQWQPLAKKSYGWAASYDLRFVDAVRFRATFSDGVQTPSCWFTHPAGTERCGLPMPTGAWRVQAVGGAGARDVDGSAMADLDGNGRAEVYVLGADGLVQHRKDGPAWTSARILAPSPTVGWTEALAMTIGDADDDGRMDIYSAVRTFEGTHTSSRIFMTGWTGSGFASEEVAHIGAFVDDMAVGDVNEDGDKELWIAVGLAVGRVDRTPSFWNTEHVASLPEAAFGIAIGDADRDGDAEAYVTTGLNEHARLWRIDAHPEGHTLDLIAHSTALGARDIVVGDGDNDGQVEAYVMDSAYGDDIQVMRFSFSGGVWNERRIDLGPGHPLGLDLADGDGDGRRELYVSDWDGRLLQAAWTGSAWSGRAVAQLGSGHFLQEMAFADVEGDGQPESYGFAVDPATQPGTCCNEVTMYRIERVATLPFDAMFTGVRGNEWWIQANVAASGGTLSTVDVRLNDGAWQALAKQSWGGWAKSIHIVQGTTVQLRATSTAGATDLSDCYRWIPASGTDAAKVTCDGSPPPTFDASFTGVKGNEWWVQATVSRNQAIAAVHASVDCGAWQALENKGWGWAKSIHVPNGAKVTFRATSTSGATDVSGGYVWPNATPTSGCP